MISPLRYPGGKTRAIKHILPHFPADVKRVCSPFLGGGSLEITLAQKGVKVYGYDLFWPLYNFWYCAAKHKKELMEQINKLKPTIVPAPQGAKAPKRHRLGKEKFIQLRALLGVYQHHRATNPTYAAYYYAINRASFSGATLSGGYSKEADAKRFNEKAIKRLCNFKEPNLKVGFLSFEDSLEKHKNDFLYLDPPYYLDSKSRLYGVSGDLHQGFEHDKLHSILTNRTGWIMSYNDCENIRQLYKDYDIIEADWAMGMKNAISPQEARVNEIFRSVLQEIAEKKDQYKINSDELNEWEKRGKEILEKLKKPQGKSSEILIMAK